MKKNVSKRVLSAFLAVMMVFVMIPFSVFTSFAVEESLSEEEKSLPQIDYTPFLIESIIP